MGKKEKLIARLKSKPKDFKFNEAKTLMGLCGYSLSDVGKTSGSRVRFTRGKKVYRMHKPHPRNELPVYQVLELIDVLEKEGLI